MSDQPVVIEEHRALSQSKLWDLQRQLYVTQGRQAWREGGVPNYITTNAFAARSYARVVLGHLRGVLAGRGTARREGARILELGAGSGRFAFHFLQHFLPMWRESELSDVPVTYILSDVAPGNVDFCRGHSAFAPFVQRGQLRFALCDAESPGDLGKALGVAASGRLEGQLVVIANYVFDALRQDIFHVEERRLWEGVVRVVSQQEELDPADPNPFASVALDFTRREITSSPYGDRIWNRILEDYRLRIRSGTLLFPTNAMRCLERLRGLSPDSLLVLAADEGSHRLDDVRSLEPRVVGYGRISLPEFPVNFHAIGEYTLAHGGQAAFASHQTGGLCVAALAWDRTGRECAATKQAFTDAIDLFGPDEFFLLLKSLERTAPLLTCAEMLAHLRWSAWDASVLHALLPQLRDRLTSASRSERLAWSEALERVWSMYYLVDREEGDVAFAVGTMLMRLGDWQQATAFLQRSRSVWGDDCNTLCNLAVCHARLGDKVAAVACVDRALEVTPHHEGAARLRRDLVPAG
jgi:hypothetical protein